MSLGYGRVERQLLDELTADAARPHDVGVLVKGQAWRRARCAAAAGPRSASRRRACARRSASSTPDAAAWSA